MTRMLKQVMKDFSITSVVFYHMLKKLMKDINHKIFILGSIPNTTKQSLILILKTYWIVSIPNQNLHKNILVNIKI